MKNAGIKYCQVMGKFFNYASATANWYSCAEFNKCLQNSSLYHVRLYSPTQRIFTIKSAIVWNYLVESVCLLTREALFGINSTEGICNVLTRYSAYSLYVQIWILCRSMWSGEFTDCLSVYHNVCQFVSQIVSQFVRLILSLQWNKYLSSKYINTE